MRVYAWRRSGEGRHTLSGPPPRVTVSLTLRLSRAALTPPTSTVAVSLIAALLHERLPRHARDCRQARFEARLEWPRAGSQPCAATRARAVASFTPASSSRIDRCTASLHESAGLRVASNSTPRLGSSRVAQGQTSNGSEAEAHARCSSDVAAPACLTHLRLGRLPPAARLLTHAHASPSKGRLLDVSGAAKLRALLRPLVPCESKERDSEGHCDSRHSWSVACSSPQPEAQYSSLRPRL